MPLTPDEVRHRRLRRVLLGGYRRRGVEELLNELADNFEDVSRERSNLFDRLHELRAEAAKHHELETLLRTTIMAAQRAVRDMKEQAFRESDLIVREAHAEARRVTREAAAEKRRLEDDLIRIRGLLRTALDIVAEKRSEEEKPSEAPPAGQAVVEEPSESGIRKVAG